MYDSQRHGFCSEFYTLEKTIEVVVTIGGESEAIRIDALKKAALADIVQRHIGKNI